MNAACQLILKIGVSFLEHTPKTIRENGSCRLCATHAQRNKNFYMPISYFRARVAGFASARETRNYEKCYICKCNMAARADFLFIAFHANVDIFILSTIISLALRNNGRRDTFNSQLLTRYIFSVEILKMPGLPSCKFSTKLITSQNNVPPLELTFLAEF